MTIEMCESMNNNGFYCGVNPKNGEKLETEKLVWDEANKTIYTDAFVKITTADQVIMGKGLKSNQDFTKYQINEITGTINLKNNEL